MNKPIERFFTPDEVRALQKPYVKARVHRINAALLRGSRHHWVPAPLFDDVALLLRAAGWAVANPRPVVDGAFMAFDVSDASPEDAALVDIGSRLVSEKP